MISEIETPEEWRHGLGPIWAAARVANPDFASADPVTFFGGAVFKASAAAWRESVFLPLLMPALSDVLRHARRGELRELCALDQRLSESLHETARAGSLRADRRLALRGCSLQGDRLLPRLGDAVRRSSTPGHLPIVFAARCAAFSLSDRITTGAYLFQEMCAGSPTAGLLEVCDFVAACLEPLEGSSAKLRAA